MNRALSREKRLAEPRLWRKRGGEAGGTVNEEAETKGGPSGEGDPLHPRGEVRRERSPSHFQIVWLVHSFATLLVPLETGKVASI